MYFPLGYLIHLPSCFDLLRVKVMKVNLFVYQISSFLCLKYKNNIKILVGTYTWSAT